MSSLKAKKREKTTFVSFRVSKCTLSIPSSFQCTKQRRRINTHINTHFRVKGNTRLEIKRERDEFSESIQHREQKRRERARDDVQGVVIALRIRDLWNGDALQGGYQTREWDLPGEL